MADTTDEQTTATEAAQVAASTSETAQTAVDDFDKDRAMATISKLRSFEKDAKAKLKRLEELEAADQQRKDADLSESEKLRKQLAELQDQHAKAHAELRRARLLQAAQRAADKANLAFHPGAIDDALRLGVFDALEDDDDGQPKGMTAAVNALAKDRPYLLKPAAATGADLDARARGTTTKQDEEARRLEKNATRWGIRLAK